MIIADVSAIVVAMMRSCVFLAVTLALASTASAERDSPLETDKQTEPPKKPRPPSLTLPQGAVGGHLAFELGMAKDNALKPTSLAPDLSIGVADRVTLAIVSSGYALTGFRGSAGWGFCVSGTEGTCKMPVAAGGLEGLVGITTGSAALAADVGVLWSAFEPAVHTDLKLGFKLKLSEGRLSVLMQPNVWLALDDRDNPTTPHEHQLWFPVGMMVKVTPSLATGVGTGVKGPLDRFVDRVSIPVGAVVQFSLDSHVSVGSSFVFGKLWGASDVMNTGLDARVVQIWLNLTSG